MERSNVENINVKLRERDRKEEYKREIKQERI